MKSYTVDTVAFLRYMVDKLPPKADKIFRSAESGFVKLVVPSIVVGEIIFTILKGKKILAKRLPSTSLDQFLDLLTESTALELTDLTLGGWRSIQEIDLPELHDRMIVATYQESQSEALITNDPEITKLPYVKRVWT